MLQIGEVVNDTYVILQRIGSGGGGIVFKAYHKRLKKYVAIKLIRHDIQGRIDERSETDILKNLKHEGLPLVYDFISDGENICTVMEYVDGVPLSDIIKKNGRLPYGQCLDYAKELCSAAAYLHTRTPKIIHCDIKPKNIMITYDGNLCLIDFNISSVFGGSNFLIGTSEGYSPPEQYAAKKSTSDDEDTVPIGSLNSTPYHPIPHGLIDERSDVYGIGAVMYAMASGCKPNSPQDGVVPLENVAKDLPEEYIRIVNKAMSFDKSDRYESAREMLAEIEKISVADSGASKATSSNKRQKMRLFGAAAFTAVLIAVIASFALANSSRTVDLSDESFDGITVITPTDGEYGDEQSEISETALFSIEYTEEQLENMLFELIKNPDAEFEQTMLDAVESVEICGNDFYSVNRTIEDKYSVTSLTASRGTEEYTTDFSDGSSQTYESGSISDIRFLSRMRNLTHLYISMNGLYDISALNSLTGLEFLVLQYDNIVSVDALSACVNLKELDLKGNYITDIGALSGCVYLEKLIL